MYRAAGQGCGRVGGGFTWPVSRERWRRRRHVPAALGNAPLWPAALGNATLCPSSPLTALQSSLCGRAGSPPRPARPAARASAGRRSRRGGGRACPTPRASPHAHRPTGGGCPERLTAGRRVEGAGTGRHHGQAPSRPDHVPQAARHRCAPRRGGFSEAGLHPAQLMADDMLLCWCSYRAALRKMYALA